MAGKDLSAIAVPVSDLAHRRSSIRYCASAPASRLASSSRGRRSSGRGSPAAPRPEKIQWPRRLTTTIRSSPRRWWSPARARPRCHLQHETSEIIGRVNAFLGFSAIGRIRIVQKPVDMVAAAPKPAPAAPLALGRRSALAGAVGKIEDDGLRAALERLGATILGIGQSKG